MPRNNNLQDLLSGFFADRLTSKEKSDLYHYLIDDSYKEVILAWLQEEWINESRQTGSINSSEKMFEKIRMEIEGHSVASKPFIYWKIFLRYAAVILFAFGLSWILLKTLTKPANREIIAEISPQYNEIYVPYGSKTKVMLPDSSTVWLNSGARLQYPVNFNDNQRHVNLQGEGFFEITKDSRHPFVVYSGEMNITVLGTKFNVMANTDDRLIETTLVEGAVEIQWLIGETEKQSATSLKPGQKLILRKEKEQYEFQSIQESGLSIAWMEGKLVFDEERFGDAKIKLERWYGVTIEVRNPEISDYQITGTFEKQTVEQAMKALSMAISCKFTINEDHIIVSK